MGKGYHSRHIPPTHVLLFPPIATVYYHSNVVDQWLVYPVAKSSPSASLVVFIKKNILSTIYGFQWNMIAGHYAWVYTGVQCIEITSLKPG